MVTSVVMRVTRPAVEYLSIFANEKDWMFSNIARRRFFAKPADAFAPYTPPIAPAKSAISAHRSIHSPVMMICFILPLLMPSSIMVDISRGIIVSMTTSRYHKQRREHGFPDIALDMCR